MKKFPLIPQYNIFYKIFRKKSKEKLAKELFSVKDNKKEDFLSKSLSDKKPHIRFGTVLKIREKQIKSLALSLCSRLVNETCWRIKWLIIITLGEFGSIIKNKSQLTEILATLISIYDSDKWYNWIRIKVVEAIGKIGLNVEKGEVGKKQNEERDPEKRLIEKGETRKWLQKILMNDPDWRVKLDAANSLGKITKYKKEVFETLIAILKTKKGSKLSVRERAGYSLGFIGSRSNKLKISHIIQIKNILDNEKEDSIKAACAFALGESRINDPKTINKILDSLIKVVDSFKNKKYQFYVFYAQILYEGEKRTVIDSIEQLKRQQNLTSRELLLYERQLSKWKYEKLLKETKPKFKKQKTKDVSVSNEDIFEAMEKNTDEKPRKNSWFFIIVNLLLFTSTLAGNILANIISDESWTHWLTITLFVIIGICFPLIIEWLRRMGWS
ncbi:MAG: HEAT repeat domain-containing protein [Candidatus Heimdallarchaeota archaeon]|nr:HEAT repeat domain-containing protein [Candidatus Heimdallarchaeota archaeon]